MVLILIYKSQGQVETIKLELPDRNFTLKDGLLSNSVYGCLQDNTGFIWFYTSRGISKFDGHKFKNFTIENGLPTNDIWFLSMDNCNRIWIHCYDRALYFIENDQVIKAVDVPGLYIINRLTCDSAGNVYCNEPPLKFKLLKKQNGFEFINQSAHTSDKLDWSEFKVYNWQFRYSAKKDTVIISNALTNRYDSLFLNNQGLFHWPVVFGQNLYVSHSSGLYVLGDTAIVSHTIFTQNQGNNRSFLDKDSNIWLTTKDKGVFLFKNKNQKHS